MASWVLDLPYFSPLQLFVGTEQKAFITDEEKILIEISIQEKDVILLWDTSTLSIFNWVWIYYETSNDNMNSWHSTKFLPIWKTKSCSLNLYLYSFQMWKSDLKKWSMLKSTKLSPFLASGDCMSYEELLKSFERAWGRDKGEIFFKIGKLRSKGRLNAIKLVRVIFFHVFSHWRKSMYISSFILNHPGPKYMAWHTHQHGTLSDVRAVEWCKENPYFNRRNNAIFHFRSNASD